MAVTGAASGARWLPPEAGRAPLEGAAQYGCGEIGGIEFVEAGASESEFCGDLGDAELPGTEATQNIAHKRGGVPPVKLLVVFIRTRCTARRCKRSAA